MKTKFIPLVASAVSLACANADAAQMVVTQTFSSVEGNAAAVAANPDASINMPAFTIRLGSDGYQSGHTATLTLGGGATIRSAAGIGTITCTTGAGSADALVKLVYASSTSTTVTLNVVRGDLTVDARGNECAFSAGNITANASSLTSAKSVTLDYSANTGTATYDSMIAGRNVVSSTTGAATAGTSFASSPAGAYRIHSSRSQYVGSSSASTAGNVTGVINVYDSIYDTIDMSTFATNPVAGYRVRDQGVSQSDINAIAQSSIASIVTTYTGDFGWLDNDGNGCTAADLSNGWGRISLDAGTAVIDSGCTTLTVTYPAFSSDVSNAKVTMTANNTALSAGVGAAFNGSVGAKPLSERYYARSTTINRLSGGVTSAIWSSSSSTAVRWTTNGYTARIPYMPYGTGITRIIYIANNTGANATVGLTATNESGASCAASNFPTVSVPAYGQASLATSADAGITACFGAGYSGKVSFAIASTLLAQQADVVSLTGTIADDSVSGNDDDSVSGTNATTASSGSVTRAAATMDVYSAYNAGGNRVTVQNSSNNR